MVRTTKSARKTAPKNTPTKKNDNKRTASANNTSGNTSAEDSADDQYSQAEGSAVVSTPVTAANKRTRVSADADMDTDLSGSFEATTLVVIPPVASSSELANASDQQTAANNAQSPPESQGSAAPITDSFLGNATPDTTVSPESSLSAQQRQVSFTGSLENAPDLNRSRHDPENTNVMDDEDAQMDVAIRGDVPYF